MTHKVITSIMLFLALALGSLVTPASAAAPKVINTATVHKSMDMPDATQLHRLEGEGDVLLNTLQQKLKEKSIPDADLFGRDNLPILDQITDKADAAQWRAYDANLKFAVGTASRAHKLVGLDKATEANQLMKSWHDKGQEAKTSGKPFDQVVLFKVELAKNAELKAVWNAAEPQPAGDGSDQGGNTQGGNNGGQQDGATDGDKKDDDAGKKKAGGGDIQNNTGGGQQDGGNAGGMGTDETGGKKAGDAGGAKGGDVQGGDQKKAGGEAETKAAPSTAPSDEPRDDDTVE